MITLNQTEIQSLQNSADVIGLTIHEKFIQDKRNTIKMYFTTKGTMSISPVLDYKGLNNFLTGWRNCTKHNQ